MHPVILLVFCHGIHTCISAVALYYDILLVFLVLTFLVAQNAQSQRKQITLASLVAFFWSANTVSMALQWKIVSDVFISHGASLEDEFDFHIHGDTPASQAINIVRGLNTFLADVTLVCTLTSLSLAFDSTFD